MDELDRTLREIDELLERRAAAVERDLIRLLAMRRRQSGSSPNRRAPVVPIDRGRGSG